MARRTVLVSDLSGHEIPDGKGATVTISFRDAGRGTIVLDVTDREAEQMGAKGRRQARRGRKPKARYEAAPIDRQWFVTAMSPAMPAA
jgi:hypothetical protein